MLSHTTYVQLYTNFTNLITMIEPELIDLPIDLLTGWPNPTLLPAHPLQTSATEVLTNPSITNPALLYGPDEGYEPLRTHIAAWLTAFYQSPSPILTPRICITGGASQNLACVLQVFTDPIYTRNVWMVTPTYHLAARILEDAGFATRLRGIPEDEEGIDLVSLENGLRAAEADAERAGNTTPVGQVANVTVALHRGIDSLPD
jgi:DNA-binding transcriptional MocR family regulator